MSTKKQVWQYKCEFCEKKTYSASHMARHEKHCTKNINRECRACRIVMAKRVPLVEIMALIPDPKYGKLCEFVYDEQCHGELREIETDKDDIFNLTNLSEIEGAIKNIEGEVTTCPACILSALRIKKINVRATNFDFQKKMKEELAEINSNIEDERFY